MVRVPRTIRFSLVPVALPALAVLAGAVFALSARAAAEFAPLASAATPSPALAQKPGGKPPKPAPVTPAKPAAPAPRMTPWLGKYDEAKKSAKERNVPVLVMIVLEGEPSSDEYRDKVLTDPELVKKSAECVVVIANNGTHAKKSIEVVVDGAKAKRDVCGSYPMFDSCSQHQRPWDDVYREFREEDGQMTCPQTVVLLPDGKVAMRINNGAAPQPTEIIAGINGAQLTCGPGLSDAQLQEVLRTLEQGRNLMIAKTWPDAWKSWQKVIAITPKSPYGEEAAREAPKALAGMQKDLERIAAALVPGTAVKAYKELVEFGKQVAGTPLEKDAAARLKKADSDKAISAELAAWKLSNEADLLLSEARDAYEQKQEKKGERAVRKLLAKRFATTAAQEQARKLWPDIAREEDAKTPPK
jgi:hypothetical protein